MKKNATKKKKVVTSDENERDRKNVYELLLFIYLAVFYSWRFLLELKQ